MISAPTIPGPPSDKLAPEQPRWPSRDVLRVPSLESHQRFRFTQTQYLAENFNFRLLPNAASDEIERVWTVATFCVTMMTQTGEKIESVSHDRALSPLGAQRILVPVIDAARVSVSKAFSRLDDLTAMRDRWEREPAIVLRDGIAASRASEIREAFRTYAPSDRFTMVMEAIRTAEQEFDKRADERDADARELLAALATAPGLIRRELVPGDYLETLALIRKALDPERARAIAWADFTLEINRANLDNTLSWLDRKRAEFNAPTDRSMR